MSTLTSTLKVRLEPEQLAALERRAEQVDRPTSALARRAIEFYLATWQANGSEPRCV